ncbi:MAG: DUF3300 domain-containing protein [Gemmatimonadaceae bacterium]|nr:DUF3300 domain-containing protein [Gemmatimonadaceae bacterium]
MIRRPFVLFAAASLVTVAQAIPAVAQESRPQVEYSDELDRYSADQLDNLVGSIALYPDALLAQVLVAATFPDQVEEAARFVRSNGTSDIDDQAWDVSVKAVAHYPSALNMMADKPDWTAALGRAYAMQSSEVMAAVQRLRRMADAQGNLRTTPQQVVTRDEEDYVIAPAQPRVIYVPVYDPYVVYTRPIFGVSYYSSFWSFGIGFPIGGWLSYDCNWRTRSVYYNGWDTSYHGYAGGWRSRSRPYIQVTNVYVNPRYRNVYINRDVIRRRVEYRNVDRYPGVHRDTRFGRDGGSVYRSGSDSRRNVARGSDSRGSDSRRSDVRYDDGPRYDAGRRSTTPDRSRSDAGDGRGRSDAGRGQDAWNRDRQSPQQPSQQPQRDGRQAGAPATDRSGWDRGVNRAGTWGRDDTRGGQPSRSQQQAPPQEARQGYGVPDRSRDAGRGQDRGPAGGARQEQDRREAPMINPRRAESQGRPQGGGQPQQGGGQRGGSQGGGRGGDRSGRERPAV